MNSRRLCFLIAAVAIVAIGVGCSPDDNTAIDSKPAPDKLTFEGVKIFPVPPRSNNSLEARFEEDPTITYTFLWERNGEEIVGADETSLQSYHFQKGDDVKVTVTGFDAMSGTKTKLSDVVRIRNTAPVILEASTFGGRDGQPEIYVHVNAVDADEDYLRLTYQWFSNDELLEGERSETLSPLKVSKGDEVYCVIVASDGDAESLPFAANPVKLDNHAPRIGSNPPVRFNEDGEFVYKLAANDTDGDKLLFELLEGPEAMSVDKKGTIRWAPPTDVERGRSHKVRVQVSDPNGGSAVQEFNLSVPEKE